MCLDSTSNDVSWAKADWKGLSDGERNRQVELAIGALTAGVKECTIKGTLVVRLEAYQSILFYHFVIILFMFYLIQMSYSDGISVDHLDPTFPQSSTHDGFSGTVASFEDPLLDHSPILGGHLDSKVAACFIFDPWAGRDGSMKW